MQVERWLEGVRALDVLVVGDALLDEYLRGTSTRLCREAPVPVVGVQERQASPGGAGNVAVAAAALGAHVRLLSAVGDDDDGRALVGALRAAGVDADDVVVDPTRRTLAKRRVVAGDQLVVRYDEGSTAPLGPQAQRRLAARLLRLWDGARAVVVSDYGSGVVDDALLAVLADLQAASPRTLVVDAHDPARYRGVGATAVKPNALELAALLGPLGADRPAAVAAGAAALHARTGARVVAGTLDRDGAVVCEQGRPPHRTWTRGVADSRACGAGDSFTASLALGLASGLPVPAAADLAQAAADVVTGREGTSTCSADDLRAQVGGARLEDVDALAARLAAARREGRTVVLANGCFDLLHRGHVALLARAKALGDVLVVALNTDASTAALRGPDRPVHPLEDRARVLAALGCVDHLVAFDEPTAEALVGRLRPDVLVKGGDHAFEQVPEAEAVRAYGGTVRLLPYVHEETTTALVDRIRGAAASTP